MKFIHILAVLVVTLGFGLNFVIMKVGLKDFPPFLFLTLRFALSTFPMVFILPKPNVPWSLIIGVGLTVGLGQILFLVLGLYLGMPAGLSAVVLQLQAFFTVILAFFFFHEKIHWGQILAMIIAFIGIGLIGHQILGPVDFAHDDVPDMAAFGCVVIAALFFGVGNLLIKKTGTPDMLALVVWSSLVAPVPLFGISLYTEGLPAIQTALAHASWAGIGAVLYAGLFSTLVCGTLWGKLFVKYPAALVAPFSLLIPIFGMLSATIFLGEEFSDKILLASGVVILGLILNQLPKRWFVSNP